MWIFYDGRVVNATGLKLVIIRDGDGENELEINHKSLIMMIFTAFFEGRPNVSRPKLLFYSNDFNVSCKYK